jgi:tetratricopeptide (TPR) repeat protein
MKHALCAAALVCAATFVGHAAGQAPAADPLDALERALQAQPDDLKAGNDYRMTVVQVNQLKVYDRAIAFFDKLVAANPNASNAHLNYGFAYVDKIPAAGSITQVILANNALGEFTKSLELKPSWIGYYTRGNSYLFWPRIFNRTHLGVADLQEAMKMQKAGAKRFYHARVYVALGDGYWKMDNVDEATKIWREGAAEFPDNTALKGRLSAQPDALKALMDDAYDSNKRVDTNLKDLWSSQ